MKAYQLKNGRIFFCENLESSDGYSFGKLSPNGNLTWKILSPENEYRDKSEFGLLIYDSDIYICSKRKTSCWLVNLWQLKRRFHFLPLF